MRYSQAEMGRIFVLRLEQDEILHEAIEKFAARHRIKAAAVIALGGAEGDSTFVVGPKHGKSRPVTPMTCSLGDVHEIAGVGTIFPDEKGRPVLHMHAAAGRKKKTTTGCVRKGVRIWQVAEVVIFELRNARAVRKLDPSLGFALLAPRRK